VVVSKRTPLTPIEPRFIVGVTGSMQSGKQELGPTWERIGYTFVDLNPFADRARLAHFDEYVAMGLGNAIGSDGKETGAFYGRIQAEPRLHRATMEIEAPFVAQALTEYLASLPQRGAPIIVSWGYLYQLFELGIKVNHVILCRSNRETWVKRIQRRAAEMGWAGMSEEQVNGLAKLLEMDPDSIQEAVTKAYPDDHHILDTSADDWGEAKLLELIRTFWD